MKSILDKLTWKDAALIETRSLAGRLEGLATVGAATATELNSLSRQVARLGDLLEQIDERPRRGSPRRKAATS